MSDKKYVFHVARECDPIIAAGGVGDVVLQLAKKCAKNEDSYNTTIILPNYANVKLSEWYKDIIPSEKILTVPMSYKKNDKRFEKVKIFVFPKHYKMKFTLCLIDAERFIKKDHPYVYTKSEEKKFTDPRKYEEELRKEKKEIEELLRNNHKLLESLKRENEIDELIKRGKEIDKLLNEIAELIKNENDPQRYFCGSERPPEDKVKKGMGHFDFFAMNVLLQKSVIKYIRDILKPEGKIVIHGHDAHTAGLPFIAKNSLEGLNFTGKNITYVVTAHNCGYAYRQQISDISFASSILGVNENEILKCMIDGAFDPFGAALLHADSINTVSEGYAWEIEQGTYSNWITGTDEDLVGFCKFLKSIKKKIPGITNGIDPSIKGPENLSGLLSSININSSNIKQDFGWKKDFKKSFVKERLSKPLDNWGIQPEKVFGNLNNYNPDNALFTFVGRLTNQKAPDIIFRAIEEIFTFYDNIGICILGDSEDERIKQKLLEIKNRFDGRIIIITGYSKELADEIYAAGDFFLIPSRFEPCGLIDLIAQLNGNIPIANQVGGLSKIVNGKTGIGYFGLNDRENLRGLVDSIHKSIEIFNDKSLFNKIRDTANRYVRENFTWDNVFPEYEKLYRL